VNTQIRLTYPPLAESDGIRAYGYIYCDDGNDAALMIAEQLKLGSKLPLAVELVDADLKPVRSYDVTVAVCFSPK
jgi:hypothetical protein